MSSQGMLDDLSRIVSDLPPDMQVQVHQLAQRLGSHDEATRRKFRRAMSPLLHGENPWAVISPIEFVGKMEVSPTVEFTAALYFPREHRVNCEGIVFSHISDDFLGLTEKTVERHVLRADLRAHRLIKQAFSDDNPVVTALGGDSVIVTPFCQVYKAIKASSNGRNGLLSKIETLLGFCVEDYETQERWFVRISDVPTGWVIGTQPFTCFEDVVNGCHAIVTR